MFALDDNGIVVVESDAPCELAIDGKVIGIIDFGKFTSVSVRFGEHILDCKSVQDGRVAVRRKIDVDSRRQQILTLEILSELRKMGVETSRRHFLF